MASSSLSTPFSYSPKLEVAHSSLFISTFSFASLSFNKSIRNKRTRRLVPKSCSSQNESTSPLIEQKKKIKKERPSSVPSPLASANQRPRTRFRSSLLRSPRLWKRIFFASKKVRSIIVLNIITVIYASDIPVLKEVEQIMDPSLFNVVRFAITAIPFLPFVLKAREDSQTRAAGIELGFWLSLGYLSQALGLLTSEAGQASFLSAFTVIVVPLIDGIFGATVSTLTWTGALVSLIGVGILEYGGSPPCVGDVLIFLSAVFFGVHILRTEQISRTTRKDNFFALLGYEVCVVALSSGAWFLFRGMFGDDVQQLSFESGSSAWSALWNWLIVFPWVPVIYTGLFSTGLCLWAEMDAMRDVSATETAIIYGLEPVWGAAFAWFLLGERWGTAKWIGAVLVLCGSLTVQVLGSSHEESLKKQGDSNRKCDNSSTSSGQNDLSLSTVVINSRRNTGESFRKQDKL